ncbi:MAG: Flp pilus assembly complex ATPase component TadA [Lactobacillales bacterium]|jgi:competence protein ComGA|nr:Flp pilus assembly complex ATPase component TadA [Lactobacillales bacterium]
MNIEGFAVDLIVRASQEHVQDIYFLPVRGKYEISYRQNEERVLIAQLAFEQGEKLINYFKYKAQMDVSEKTQPQYGSFEMSGVKMRLSSVSEFQFSETLVIRLLHDFVRGRTNYYCRRDYDDLFEETRAAGLYLFSGPVGSGKTTLMYELCRELAATKQVIAIEDPVEIADDNLLQLQINEKIGIDYNALIKVCLRHRPDVLIIGEIRDALTMRAALRASLTGHKVFATIHAQSVPGVIARCLELGAAESELSQVLRGVVYQRIITSDYGVGVLMEKKYGEYEKNGWPRKVARLVECGFIQEEKYYEKI